MENNSRETNVITKGVRFKIGNIRYTLYTNFWINEQGKTEKVYQFQIFRDFSEAEIGIMVEQGYTLMKKFKGKYYGAYKVFLRADTAYLFMALWTAMSSRAEDICLNDWESINIDILIEKIKGAQKDNTTRSMPIRTNLRIKK